MVLARVSVGSTSHRKIGLYFFFLLHLSKDILDDVVLPNFSKCSSCGKHPAAPYRLLVRGQRSAGGLPQSVQHLLGTEGRPHGNNLVPGPGALGRETDFINPTSGTAGSRPT